MTKRVNVLPSLRIDKTDYLAGTTTFSTEADKLFAERCILDNYARIAEGFRVQISNQTTFPGQFTVYNGVAFDRSGQIVVNEEDLSAQLSATLITNATYYVEVEFVTSNSDIDSRAFWDPDYDNGSDPSGDTRIPGKEFVRAVSTRIAPSWRLVSPISTSGFDLSSNPNSTKIPVAILTTSGSPSAITGGTTASARSTLRESVSSGTTVKVLDSRHMPDAFTGTIDAETITVVSNDRENGILTTSGAIGSSHTAGTRVIVAGGSPPVFLVERSDANPSGTTTQDARPKLFKGDEERGYLVERDPDASTGSADKQIYGLKDYVDFLAAQVRELKFGAARSIDLGKTAPPSSWSASPRYYEYAGGVAGARGFTVTVGNGTDVWGDFNASAYSGDAAQAIQAAYAALPSGGGTIYIKGSNTAYVLNSAVTITVANKHVIFIGDGTNSNLTASSTNNPGLFDISAGSSTLVQFIRLNLTRGSGTGAYMVTGSNDCQIRAFGCTIDGLSTSSGKLLLNSIFEDCTLRSNSATAGNAHAIDADLSGCNFRNCIILNNLAQNASYAINMRNGSTNAFYNCDISISNGSSTTPYVVNTPSSCINVIFDTCNFSSANTTLGIFVFTDSSFVKLINCISSCGNGFVNFDGINDAIVSGCYVSYGSNVTAIAVGSTNTSYRNIISNCTFVQGSSSGTSSYAISLNKTSHTSVNSCVFKDTDIGIKLGSNVLYTVIDGCRNNSITSSRGRFGIYADTNSGIISNIVITNCMFNSMVDSGVSSLAGITFTSNVPELDNLKIHNCTFDTIGTSSTTTARGIRIGCGLVRASISNCTFSNINAANSTGTSEAIKIEGTDSLPNSDVHIVNNAFFNIGNTTGAAINVISIDRCSDLVVGGNTMRTIGHATNTTGNIVGVYVGVSATTLPTGRNINISNNVFNRIISASSETCIFVKNGGAKVNVSGNIVEVASGATGTVGITLTANNATGPVFNGLIVANNNISSVDGTSVLVGIEISVNSLAEDEMRATITGNILKDYVTGIYVLGSDTLKGWTICNNTLISGIASAVGIKTADVSVVTVVGNTVVFTGTTNTAHDGIITKSDNVVVSNNSIIMKNATTGHYAITVQNLYQVISGNVIDVGGTNNNGIKATAGATKVFVSGNVLHGNNASAIDLASATAAYSKARKDAAADGPPTDTSTLNDIGLNITGF